MQNVHRYTVSLSPKALWSLPFVLSVALHAGLFYLVMPSMAPPIREMNTAITIALVDDAGDPTSAREQGDTAETDSGGQLADQQTQIATQPAIPQPEPEPVQQKPERPAIETAPTPVVETEPLPVPSREEIPTDPTPTVPQEQHTIPTQQAAVTSGEHSIGMQKEATPPGYGLGSVNNPAPAYPNKARIRGWEGLVVLSVHVDKDGWPLEVSVKQSSGYALLDRAARSTVRKWRFSPAMEDGQAVAGITEVPIEFRLS